MMYMFHILLSIIQLVNSMPQGLVISPTTTTATTTNPTTITATKNTTLPTLLPVPVWRHPSEVLSPEISSFHVTSIIQFRYAKTVIESHIKNPDIAPQHAGFNVVLPESAFISNFSMEVNGEEFVARVEEKNKAEETFKHAVNTGQGAGLVTQDVRDSNRFTVSANVKPGHKIIFRLTYDQLLERKQGMYEQVINIDLKEIVQDFRVKVNINESLPITDINVPELIQSNEIDFEEDDDNSIAVIERDIDGDPRNAEIVFAPSKEDQEAAEEQRVSGQLVIRYDVDRQGQDSEVQVVDGYFVHYFVPENLDILPKHMIFILDTSGSMNGEKIQQLKDSMFVILNDLKPSDFFTIITFSSLANHWKAGEGAIPATKENRKEAIKYILDLDASGGTNINSAILKGIQVSKDLTQKEALPENVTPMLIFLSDGEATEGETSSSSIKSNINEANAYINLPIFSVAFGGGADFQLLKDVSQSTDSFAKRIYEDSDAALQLESFYQEISNPVVRNLKFNYVGELVSNDSISDTKLRTLFQGGQYVVVGKLEETGPGGLEVIVTGETRLGNYEDTIQICLRDPSLYDVSHPSFCHIPPVPRRSEAQKFMKSLHAFLNVKQLLKKDNKEDALKIALDSNFVTPITSLVVVRPDQDDSIANIKETGKDKSHSKISNRNRIVSGLVGVGVANLSPQVSFKRKFASPRRPSVQNIGFSLGGSASRLTTTSPNPIRRYFSASRLTTTSPNPIQRYFDDQYDLGPVLGPNSLLNGTAKTGTGLTTTTTMPTTTAATYTTTDLITTTTTTTVSPSCTGNLTLYSSTYHRGEELTLMEDLKDLSSFSDLAVSATLQGSCCWMLYADPDFYGHSYKLEPNGEYKTTNSFGRILFQDVSSVQKVFCT